MSTPQQLSAFNNQIPQRYTIKSLTAAYTVTGADYGAILQFSSTGAITCSLPPAATVGVGFNVWIWSDKSTGLLTISPISGTISAAASISIARGNAVQVISDGLNWMIGSVRDTNGFAFDNAGSYSTRAVATGSGSFAIGYAASATAGFSAAIGTNSGGSGSQTVTGGGAMALGGSYASGQDSFAAAIGNNTSTYGAQGTNSIAIGNTAKSTGAGSVAIGVGATSTTNYSVSIGYGAQTTTGTYALALGASTSATTNGTAIGLNSAGNGSTVTGVGYGGTAIGGSYASGADSFAASIANITSTYGAQGTNSIALSDRAKATAGQSVAIGQLSQATGTSSVCLSGYGAVASGTASIAIGTNSDFGAPTASGQGSIVIGDGVVATQRYSVALGYGASSAVSGKFASSSGRFAAAGDSQQASLVLRAATTDATATVLLSYSTSASATNQIILPNNSAYTFSIMIVARQSAAGGTKSAAWKIEGLIRQEGTAASTTLVSSILTTISNVPGWGIAVSADTTNGGLAITATGAAATNIRWVATAQTSEVTYA